MPLLPTPCTALVQTPWPHKARRLALCLVLVLSVVASGCATRAPVPPPPPLLADHLFVSTQPPFDPQSLFALDDSMQQYLEHRLPKFRPGTDSRRALVQALFEQSELQLRYDGGHTRTASEAFAARAGNCLSLVIMTAAFARHLGVPVSYRSVAVPDTYSRSGELYMASRHVNLALGPLPAKSMYSIGRGDWLTVDFLPQAELGTPRTAPLAETTIVAMYLNNRAAEALSDGQVDQAYGWARAAVLQDPHLATAVNTLAVVYQRAGHLAEAETALRHVLAAEPEHTAALSNLVGLLGRTGRGEQSAALAQRLARLQPVPPFEHFNLGRQAMLAGDLAAALDHFEQELRHQPYQDEVHFWLAQTHWRLGHTEQARKHLRLAAENSVTASSHDRYAAKLALLRGAAQAH